MSSYLHPFSKDFQMKEAKFCGFDNFGRATFKYKNYYYCIVDVLWNKIPTQKEIDEYILTSKGYDFDDEPGFPCKDVKGVM